MISISSNFWRTLTRRALPSLAAMTLSIPGNLQADHKLLRHNKYWFDDGSLILRAQNDIYKVHRTLLERHSRTLSTLHPSEELDKGPKSVDGLAVMQVPDELEVRSGDLEVLLEHLYHDVVLDERASFPRLASLLRVSSEQQLDFPSIHALAKSRLEELFPANPAAFLRSEYAEEALALSVKYDIPSIRKPLYYTVATHPHERAPQEQDLNSTTTHPGLAPEVTARCDALLESLLEHFTPVLFTVATAGHMACTDVFAEKWMPLVIQPALDDNGLCRPLETLERIIAIDWVAEGLCPECVKEKTEEWRGEQRDVWGKMDKWLS
ncbi:hypothetical protein BD309DRAFT_969200 [Dichomitus squalens]|nr:hypothetical protein BD309DRAFT_969200 [Dichomitus squalens]